MKNRQIFSYFMRIGAFLVISLLGCSSPEMDENIPVKTMPVKNHFLKTSLTLSGVLLPTQTADVSSRIAGQVQSVRPDVGSMVKKGDVLVVLDTEKLNAQLTQAEAGLKSAEAAVQEVQSRMELAKINLNMIQKNYDRTKALFDSGIASQSQLDDLTGRLDTAVKQYKNTAGPELDKARAVFDTTKANIQYLQVQIDSATIRSPINGIVTNRNADPGEVVSPGVTVISVANTATLKMKTNVTQDLLPLLEVGQEIDVTVDIYPDRILKGVISGIGPIAVNTGGIFPLEIAIGNDGSILSGLSAHAMLNLTGKKGVVVPSAAVLEIGEKSYVFVIQDGVAIQRDIITGLRNDQEMEVLKGLEVGEKVAVSNVRVLTDNMPVDIQK
jgi:HlyD family secretion protein